MFTICLFTDSTLEPTDYFACVAMIVISVDATIDASVDLFESKSNNNRAKSCSTAIYIISNTSLAILAIVLYYKSQDAWNSQPLPSS